jgi:two-component system, sensor histidine kinase and response regulator
MNDYVIKPIDRQALLRTVRRWLLAATGGEGEGEAAASASAPAPEPPPLSTPTPSLEGVDIPGALKRLGFDFGTLRQMLVRFADGLAPNLAGLRGVVASGDAPETARRAHAMAGAAGNLGVDGLSAAAKALEHAVRAGRTDMATLFAEVEQCAAVALRSIDTLLDVATAVHTGTIEPPDTTEVRPALDRQHVAPSDFELSATTDALAGLTALDVPVRAEPDLTQLRDLVDRYDDEAPDHLRPDHGAARKDDLS